MRTESRSLLRTLLGIAAVGIILLAMNAAALTVNMIMLGLVLAICFVPLMNALQRRGVGKGISMIITSLILVLGGFGLIIFIFLSFAQLLTTLPEYQQELAARFDQLGLAVGGGTIVDSLNLSPEQVVPAIAGFIAGAANTIYVLGFTLIVGVFMLWEELLLPAKVRRFLAPDGVVVTTFREFAGDLREFVLITAKTGLMVAAIDVVFLLIVGVDFALLWGVVSFLMSFIPSVGFLISVIPPMIMAFVQYGWEAALLVLIGYWAINGVIDNFVKPRFIGVGLNLSPLVVFLSLIVWGWALGLMGALLSVPYTLVVYKFLLQPRESTRWVADMMLYSPEDAPEIAAEDDVAEVHEHAPPNPDDSTPDQSD